jgi:hypothetical protein
VGDETGLRRRRPSLTRRGARSDRDPKWRSMALAVIAHMSGCKRDGHACRRAASHRDGHQKDEQILHRSIQRRQFHEGSERLAARVSGPAWAVPWRRSTLSTSLGFPAQPGPVGGSASFRLQFNCRFSSETGQVGVLHRRYRCCSRHIPDHSSDDCARPEDDATIALFCCT